MPGGGGTFFPWENTLTSSFGTEGGLKVELGDRDNEKGNKGKEEGAAGSGRFPSMLKEEGARGCPCF